MNSFLYILQLENNENSHLGRLLILIDVFARNDGTHEIKGLTKLAKLDFLLRYPVYLERALNAIRKNFGKVEVKPYERESVESRMVRFKYGPWDFHYRRYINLLIAKGLIYIRTEGRTNFIGVTELGRNTTNNLLKNEIHSDTFIRAKLIRQYFDISATNLMNFIYTTFPEIGTMQYGKEIE